MFWGEQQKSNKTCKFFSFHFLGNVVGGVRVYQFEVMFDENVKKK